MVDDDDWCRSARCLIGRFLKEKKMGKINLDLVFTYINGFELSMFCYFATTTAHYVMSSLWLQLIYIYILGGASASLSVDSQKLFETIC